MLVLTRKLQETIKIGEQVTIYVLRVKGNTVRLGIDAPREIRVVRGELTEEPATAGQIVTNKLPLDPGPSRAGAPKDASMEERPGGSAPALSGFFPRVPKTVQFPPMTMDTNHDSIGT